MDIAIGLRFRLKQILSKLKQLNIVRSYSLKIDFERIGENVKDCLLEINALLRKCVKKIRSKPRRAEIRNVIGELVRKKNTGRRKDTQSTSEVTAVSENQENSMQFDAGGKYLCEFCGFDFIYYSSLKVHISKLHESGATFKVKKRIPMLSTGDVLEGLLHSENISEGIDCTHLEYCREEQDNPCQSSKYLHADIAPDEMTGRLPGSAGDKDSRIGSTAMTSYLCPHSGCKNIFQKQGSLKKHIRIKHSAQIHYRCTKCEKIFFEKGKLNRHMLTHQRGQFQCSTCRQAFNRMDNLRRHISLHHENMKRFECRFCKRKFSLKFNRDTHEVNVHANADIQCESCGKKCKNEATLKVHKRLHEENRISCSLCCKTFTRKAHYQIHLKNKHKGLSPFQKLFDSFVVLGPNSP